MIKYPMTAAMVTCHARNRENMLPICTGSLSSFVKTSSKTPRAVPGMTARQIFKRAKFFVCWVVTVLAKATVWVLAIVVRWVSRVVCTVVQIVIGVFMAPFDEGKAFKEAVGDVWELVKDVFIRQLDLSFTTVSMSSMRSRLL